MKTHWAEAEREEIEHYINGNRFDNRIENENNASQSIRLHMQGTKKYGAF